MQKFCRFPFNLFNYFQNQTIHGKRTWPQNMCCISIYNHCLKHISSRQTLLVLLLLQRGKQTQAHLCKFSFCSSLEGKKKKKTLEERYDKNVGLLSRVVGFGHEPPSPACCTATKSPKYRVDRSSKTNVHGTIKQFEDWLEDDTAAANTHSYIQMETESTE